MAAQCADSNRLADQPTPPGLKIRSANSAAPWPPRCATRDQPDDEPVHVSWCCQEPNLGPHHRREVV